MSVESRMTETQVLAAQVCGTQASSSQRKHRVVGRRSLVASSGLVLNLFLCASHAEAAPTPSIELNPQDAATVSPSGAVTTSAVATSAVGLPEAEQLQAAPKAPAVAVEVKPAAAVAAPKPAAAAPKAPEAAAAKPAAPVTPAPVAATPAPAAAPVAAAPSAPAPSAPAPSAPAPSAPAPSPAAPAPVTASATPPQAVPPAAPEVAPSDAAPGAAAPAPVSAEAAASVGDTGAGADVAVDAGPIDETPAGGYVEAADDVVRVTVDRRSKDIQHVSASAEAFSGETLERKGVRSLRDMTAVTPYIEVGTQEGNFEIYIRGVGNNNNTEIGDPAAAMHVDGIYIPRPRGAGSMYYDLDRVEIARGPQGTLRGRNATAGTLNIVTNQPVLGEWGMNSGFELGNYNGRIFRGMVNAPIGKDVAIRLAAYSERHDPFYKNSGGNPELRAAEDADTLSYRGSVKWQPAKNVSLLVRADNTLERGTGWVGSNFTQALREGVLPEEIPDVRSVAYVGHQPKQSLDHWGINATLNVDLGPAIVEFTSSYRELDYRQTTGTTNGVNFNGKPAGNLDRYDSSYWHTSSDSLVNELRVFAPDTASFRWSAGLFHLFEKQRVMLYDVVDNNWGWSGTEWNHPDVADGAIAGFADATLDLLKEFRVLGGLRLTHDYKRRNGIGYGFGFGCDGDDPACQWGPERFGTEGFVPADEGRTDYTFSEDVSTRALDDDGNPIPGSGRSLAEDFLNGVASFGARDTLRGLVEDNSASVGTMNEQHGKADDTFLDFRVGAEYDLAPESLLYVTFSTGHKSGGFNDTLDTYGTQPPTFDPEVVYATEVGSKNTLLNNKITLNAAAFWYAYENYQAGTVEGVNTMGPDGTPLIDQDTGQVRTTKTSFRKNTGNVRVLGLDFEFKAKLPMGFGSRIAGVAMDGRFLGASVSDTRVSWDPNSQPIVSLKDKLIPRAPQLALTYGVDQKIPSSIGYFDWSVSGQTKSKMYMTYFNGEGKDYFGNTNPLMSDVVPWSTRFDASVGFTRLEGDITFDLFVSNLTNMTYMTSLINTPDLNLRFYNPPRQFGFRVSGTI